MDAYVAKRLQVGDRITKRAWSRTLATPRGTVQLRLSRDGRRTIQKINRKGTRLWSVYTGEGQEDRRVAALPDGNLVYTGAEASRIEFRRATNGSLIRSWSVLSDGSGVNYPYGIQVCDYQI